MKKGRFLALALAFAAASFATSGPAMASGEKVYKKCKACHTLDGKHKVGPTLKGIFGRKAGTADGFTKYSDDMKMAGEKGLTWSPETLATYIKKGTGADGKKTEPKMYIGAIIGKKKAKTKMAFNGLKKDKDIAALISYLQEKAK